MTTLDDIAGRDAESPTDECESCREYAATEAQADRRYLLGLVREAREALDDIKKSVIFVGGFQHGRTNHRQHPLTCTDEFCRSSRAIEDRAEALLLRLTEGSDRT